MMIFLINLVKGYDVIKRIYYFRQRMIREDGRIRQDRYFLNYRIMNCEQESVCIKQTIEMFLIND